MALSGLVHAGLRAFAPTQVAIIGGAVPTGIAVTFGYCPLASEGEGCLPHSRWSVTQAAIALR